MIFRNTRGNASRIVRLRASCTVQAAPTRFTIARSDPSVIFARHVVSRLRDKRGTIRALRLASERVRIVRDFLAKAARSRRADSPAYGVVNTAWIRGGRESRYSPRPGYCGYIVQKIAHGEFLATVAAARHGRPCKNPRTSRLLMSTRVDLLARLRHPSRQ